MANVAVWKLNFTVAGSCKFTRWQANYSSLGLERLSVIAARKNERLIKGRIIQLQSEPALYALIKNLNALEIYDILGFFV